MKVTRTNGSLHLKIFPRGLALAVLIGATALAFGDDGKSDKLRAEAEKLMRKAEDLKAQGAGDEANQVAGEAEKLRNAARKLEKERAQLAREEVNTPGLRGIQEKLERLREKLKDLVADGKMEQAAKLKQEIAGLEKSRGGGPGLDKMAEAKERVKRMREEITELRAKGKDGEAGRLEEQLRQMKDKIVAAEEMREFRPDRPKSPGPGFGWMKERYPGQPVPPLPPEQDAQRRIQHIRIVVENLHAAGLHEPAQRLAEEVEKFQRQMQEQKRRFAPPGPEGRDGMFRAVQAEIKELRQAVSKLSQQLEELRQKR